MDKCIRMSVNTGKEYINAIMISQNAFYERTEITIHNENNSFSNPNSLVEDVKAGVKTMFLDGGERFANAQLSAYSMQMIVDPFGRNCQLNLDAKYMCTGKQLNDFTCCAAEIGELLKRKAKGCRNEYDKVLIFDRWVKAHFTYEDRDVITDHSAINLLQSREGVCQAIAALAVKVLPYMGIEAVYISGKGNGGHGWGRHAWNAVLIGNRWIHVDFTFSLNTLSLPSTRTKFESKLFGVSHKWDSKLYGNEALNYRWKLQNELCDEEMKVIINSPICVFGGVQIENTSEVLIRKDGRLWIDIMSLIRMLGGSCEVISNKDELNVCLSNQRTIIRNISEHMNGIYFDIKVLEQFGKIIRYANGIGFKATGRR